MKKTLAIALSLLMLLSFAAACGGSDEPTSAPPAPADPAAPADPGQEDPAAPAAPESDNPYDNVVPRSARDPIAVGDLKIGVILIHDENSGYDFAHIEGVRGAMAELGIADSQAIFKYNIPEDETCYDTAVDLAEQGCHIVISNSFGHQFHMMKAATEYPDIIFVASTGVSAALEPVPNVVNIFPFTFESRYISGVVAGMKLKELMDEGLVDDPHVGYVGAYPYDEVVSGYTGFFLGIRSIVPSAFMEVQYTNSWYDPVSEAEAANALMSRGAVIIGQHADSTGAPSAIQAANDSGKSVYSVGYNISMLAVAPTAALTSAQNNWAALYKPVLSKMISGEVMPADIALGIADGAVMISELGPSVADGTAEKVEEVIAAIKGGTLHVFDTANFTVDGQKVTNYAWIDIDGDFIGDVGEAIVDGIFMESVFRSAPYFGLRIDGITELN